MILLNRLALDQPVGPKPCDDARFRPATRLPLRRSHHGGFPARPTDNNCVRPTWVRLISEVQHGVSSRANAFRRRSSLGATDAYRRLASRHDAREGLPSLNPESGTCQMPHGRRVFGIRQPTALTGDGIRRPRVEKRRTAELRDN